MSTPPSNSSDLLALEALVRGLGVLKTMDLLVLTLYGALIVFALVVLLPLALAFKVPIRRFWLAIKEQWLIAFTFQLPSAHSKCS